MVFPRVPKFETWVAALKAAGIEYKAADNSILGFHSLRVTYITNLQKAGLSVSTVMELARHTDYRITKESYTDPRMLDMFGAVAALPTYEDPKTAEALGLRSGTDDCLVMAKHDANDCTYQCTQIEGATIQVGAIPYSERESRHPRVRVRNPSRKHGKTRLFSQFSGAKIKAGESGLALEGTIPSSNPNPVRNRDLLRVSIGRRRPIPGVAFGAASPWPCEWIRPTPSRSSRISSLPWNDASRKTSNPFES